jgi:2-hydroxy-6-oxonona-2,4-dienedioate hydrolase
MKPVFKTEQGIAKLTAWHEKFRARLTVPTESRTVPTRFGDTHVLVGGPAMGPALVVIHGAMASSAHLLVELAPLLERFRIYAVDVIGQSVKTPHQRPSVKNNDYGSWLADVLDGLAVKRAALIAVSWGGFAAIRLAAHAPERIERLALLVPAGIVNGYAWQGITKLAIPMMMNRLFPSEARFEKFASNLLTTLDDDWLPYLRDAFSSFNMDMRVPMLAKPAELANLQAPVFVIAGDQDVSFPGAKLIARAKELFPSFAGAELIENCKHSPPTTDEFRGWLAGKLTSFFDGHPTAVSASGSRTI